MDIAVFSLIHRSFQNYLCFHCSQEESQKENRPWALKNMAVYDIPTVAGQKKGMVGKCKSFSSWGWFCKRKCLWSHLLSQSNRKYSQFCAKKNLNSALFGIRNQDFNELVRWEGDLKSPPPPLRRLRNNNEKQFSNVKQARTKKHQ